MQFFLTLRNSGDIEGKLSIMPVRHYDDGELNESPLDEVEVTVRPGEVWRGRTPAYKYKAHEHEVESCAVLTDGIDGDEIAINAVSL